MNNRFCPGGNQQLIAKSFEHSATNGVTTNGSFTIPTGRGPVVAIAIRIGSDTIADVVQLDLTIDANGVNLLEDENALTYSPAYRGEEIVYHTYIAEGSTLGIRAVNGSAATINVVIQTFYGSGK